MLSFLANLLFLLTTLAVLYVINLRYVKLPVFPLKEISVHGVNNRPPYDGKLHYVTRQQVEQVVRNHVSGNFFTVNLSAFQQALSELPWVRTAKIYRDWPDGLKVVLEEHNVLARWGSSALVNTYGEIFRAPINKKLPVFVGPAAASSREIAQRYVNFSNILKPLRQRIAEINLSSRHAWCIRLETEAVLELGRGDAEAALARYALAYEQSIAQLGQQIQPDYLDLRYPNGFAMRLPENMRQADAKQSDRNSEEMKSGRCN